MVFAAGHPSARRAAILAVVAATVATSPVPAAAQYREQGVALLDRLCAQTLRANEEDRLFGLISSAVRSTIKYRGGNFETKLIDDSIQDSLGTLMAACPQLTAAPPDKRLNLAVDMVSEATTKMLQSGSKTAAEEPRATRAARRGEVRENAKSTAADLSQELSSQEIDAWLNSLPPRRRAAALFLYASDVTPRDIATAIGESPAAVAYGTSEGKADLLNVLRVERPEAPGTSNAGPAIRYRTTGQSLSSLMQPSTGTPAAAPAQPMPAADTAPDQAAAPPAPAAEGSPAPPAGNASLARLGSSMRVTGISNDLYSGWSLIATISRLPRGQSVTIDEPFLLEPDSKGVKRMVVVDIAEIGSPDAETRRFLLKAYAIDADKEGPGWRDGFHLGAAVIDNAEAKKTLANTSLSSIEVARCLWYDYGTGKDPGLCR